MAKMLRIMPVVALLCLMACSFGCGRKPPGPNDRTKELARLGIAFNNAKLDFNMGMQAYQAGQILDAATWLASAINRSREVTSEADFSGSTAFRADAHFWYGVVLIDVFALADKSSLDILDKQGNKIGERASPQLALSYMDKAIELNPAPPLYYWGKGYVYLKTGDSKQAISWFNTAIGRDNRDPNFYSHRALAYYELARSSEPGRERLSNLRLAQEDCSKAILLSKKQHTHAYEVLVMIYLLGGQVDQAKKVIQDMDSEGLPTNRAVEIYNRSLK
ncbi:MAG: hypothetical protein WC712_10015 [Candidatus Brocadiia bacterium]